ncbi:MAG: hypothetical protein K5989_10635, partial [Lachnospiraceae bacterium]|nr:hypothetical protein [Lachnospiraceae bacterium]
EEYLTVGVTTNDMSPKYALAAIISTDYTNSMLWGDSVRVGVIFGIIFVIVSIILLLIIYFRGADIREFEKEIRAVGLGKTKVDIPNLLPQDMKSMWTSLSETGKRLEEVNYDKYRIFEAYYRFAPKNIETIMGKNSIFEVKNGDVTTAEGTLMLIYTGDNRSQTPMERVEELNRILSYIVDYREQKDGILVSQDSSLSVLELLYLQETTGISEYAIQFLHRDATDEKAGDVSVFIYYSSFLYGIVGIGAQSLTFLSSEHSWEIEEYTKWFGSLGLRVVVTELIVNREDTGEKRYIGYILLQGNIRLSLYELLDACPARERKLKLMYREKFRETLDFYYQKDFYQARNRLSEIVKECPWDGIAKWYLFDCEHYLNGAEPEGEFGQLRIN